MGIGIAGCCNTLPKEKSGRVDLKSDIERELNGMGLAPKTWPQTLEALKAKLPKPDFETFSRLHKNFTSYRSETTSGRFYGFVFSHGLQMDVNAYRFRRLTSILTDLIPAVARGQSILDIGAGAGLIAAMLKRRCALRAYVAQDSCREVRDELTAQGFTVLPHPPPFSPPTAPPSSSANLPAVDSVPAGAGLGGGFDLLLCVDSLGEVNADDDGLLAKPDGIDAADLPEMIEQRYGFAQKLDAWKSYLAPGGKVLLWEPFAYPQAWESLAVLLRNEGWEAQLHAPAPGRNYLELAIKPV